jgi:predicted peptidase
VPPTYDGCDPFPLIVFLHGTHEKGRDGRAQLKVGLGPATRRSLHVAGAPPFNFLALFPQSRTGNWHADWPGGELVLEELADVEKQYNVDPDRVYLTGHSGGGDGTWSQAAAHPDRWAAIVPVCGDGNPRDAPRIKHIPCWCFHGRTDRTTTVESVRGVIRALKEAGGKPRYTEFDRLDHNIWRQVYAMPELHDWLAAQRRGRPPS